MLHPGNAETTIFGAQLEAHGAAEGMMDPADVAQVGNRRMRFKHISYHMLSGGRSVGRGKSKYEVQTRLARCRDYGDDGPCRRRAVYSIRENSRSGTMKEHSSRPGMVVSLHDEKKSTTAQQRATMLYHVLSPRSSRSPSFPRRPAPTC